MYLENGKNYLYQWDINQRMIVNDGNVLEVHYSNITTPKALVCGVYEENGIRYANIPNILLQQYWTIRAYGCCNDCVRQAAEIQVYKRNKPEDYVYTETEIKCYSLLEERIIALENHQSTSGVDSVNGKAGKVILTAEDVGALPINTIIPSIPSNVSAFYNDAGYLQQESLKGYYTKEETNTAINKAKPDLTPYALKTDIPSISGLASESYVDKAIEGIEFPKTDLSNYYTKSETNNAINAAKPDLTQYALKTDIPSTTGLATETYVDDAIKAIPKTDLSGYYTKTETNTAIDTALSPYAKKTDIPSTTGLASQSYVNQQIAAIPKTDLSNYYTKTETNTAINNAKPDLSPYAKKSELPSVDGLASETYVNNAIAAIPKTDLSNYYTKAQTDTAINNAKPDLAPYATKANSENWVFTLKDGSTITKKVVLA